MVVLMLYLFGGAMLQASHWSCLSVCLSVLIFNLRGVCAGPETGYEA
ncbi:hypothetical protein ACNKHW_02285 [Shigella flexneri]